MVTGDGALLQVVVIQEGAAEPYALLGILRLVDFLGRQQDLVRLPQSLVVDCGTGATAVGGCPQIMHQELV